jgi:rRNA maturation RNase YbeY
MINFDFGNVGIPEEINLKPIRLWLQKVIEEENKIVGELNYQFCSDKDLHKVNVKFLDHDTLTDIITFPTTDSNKIISGEIYLSLDRVKDNSDDLGVEFEQELKRVIVHGVLHLLEYKDKSEAEANQMRAKENYYLNKFIDF